jgi:hypothetical protein
MASVPKVKLITASKVGRGTMGRVTLPMGTGLYKRVIATDSGIVTFYPVDRSILDVPKEGSDDKLD